MFLGYQDGLIKSVWEDVTDSEGTIVSGKPPCVEFDEIVLDTKHTLKDYILVENSYVLQNDLKVVEYKCEQVRAYRDRLILIGAWIVTSVKKLMTSTPRSLHTIISI